MEGALPHFPAQSLHQNYRFIRTLKKVLPEIKTPTLLLHARHDDVSHPRNAYYIQERLRGPCKIHLLEDEPI